MTDKPASVVDYEAWNKGYMPPSEHQLIHELSYNGAKVRCASSGGENGWWLVAKGDAFDDEDMWEMMMFITEKQLARVKKLRAEKAASASPTKEPAKPSEQGGEDEVRK